MSQFAREHPELYAEGVRYEDVHDPDRIRQEVKDGERCRRCYGTGSIDREILGDMAVSVESCPDCSGTGRP